MSESSAGIIAKTIYMSAKLNTDYNIHYFDSLNCEEWYQIKTDILITLVDNFELARWYFKPKKVYLVAVNQHPIRRLSQLKSARTTQIPTEAFSASDGIYQPILKLTNFNSILCVGNRLVIESYKKYYKNIEIATTYYATQFNQIKLIKSHNKQNRIFTVLILMSSLGYRKGFDQICELITLIKNQKVQINFIIVGHAENEYWKSKIYNLLKTYQNIQYCGWVNNKSEEFKSLLLHSHLAVFPSREEGMLGALIECIEFGILSLHSENCGIDISNENLSIIINNSTDLYNKVLNLSLKSDHERQLMATEQFIKFKDQISTNDSISTIVENWLSNPSATRSKYRRIKVLKELIAQITIEYWVIYARRFKLLTIEKNKRKIYLRFPAVYKFLKRIL